MIKLIESNNSLKKAIMDIAKQIDVGGEIHFSSSGTTGAPKHVIHSVTKISNYVKTDLKAVWGLTYDFTKIAGVQVLIQANSNNNKVVNLFQKSQTEIHNSISEHFITHISATPTFFRLNFNKEIFPLVKQITLGGEVCTNGVIDLVKKVFPNAKISNIYALTEYGSVLASSSEVFTLSKRTRKTVKIVNDYLYVFFNGMWNNTGDVVELIDERSFIIIGRESTMINVGGQKVNPHYIENCINIMEKVTHSKVFGIKNSLTGNIIAADIAINGDLDIKTIKKLLKQILKPYEVPRIINIVSSIELNSTGKISRI